MGEKHDKVAWVRYAALGGPNYDLHKKYCPNGAGSLFTFGLKGGYEAGKKLVDSVKMISLVANLGDSRTLIAHPSCILSSPRNSGGQQVLRRRRFDSQSAS